MLEIDARGLKCPMPVLLTQRALVRLGAGGKLYLQCTDPMAQIDIPVMLSRLGARLIKSEMKDTVYHFWIEKGEATGECVILL